MGRSSSPANVLQPGSGPPIAPGAELHAVGAMLALPLQFLSAQELADAALKHAGADGPQPHEALARLSRWARAALAEEIDLYLALDETCRSYLKNDALELQRVDRRLARVRASLHRQTRRAQERARVRWDATFEQCLAELHTRLELAIEPVRGGNDLRCREERWDATFATWIELCEARASSIVAEAGPALAELLGDAVGQIAPHCEFIATTPRRGLPEVVRPGPSTFPVRRVQHEPWTAALTAQLRGNLATFGIAATVVAVAFADVFGQAGSGIAETGGGAVLVVLPVCVALAFLVVRQRRARALESAAVSHRHAIFSQAKGELTRTIDRYRKATDAWIGGLADECAAYLDRFQAEVVDVDTSQRRASTEATRARRERLDRFARIERLRVLCDALAAADARLVALGPRNHERLLPQDGDEG